MQLRFCDNFLMAEDPANPPLLQAMAKLTGLQRAEGNGLPPPAALQDHQDLWAFTHAGFRFLAANPDARIIRPADIATYLRSVLSGDKRTKRVQAARDRQLQRTLLFLEIVHGDIVIDEAGVFTVRPQKR